jgi:hypothetical protein
MYVGNSRQHGVLYEFIDPFHEADHKDEHGDAEHDAQHGDEALFFPGQQLYAGDH